MIGAQFTKLENLYKIHTEVLLLNYKDGIFFNWL